MTVIIGQKLREAREARELTLAQAANATHIREHYLRALEAGDFSQLPSAVQAKGFLRLYAGYLGLDEAALLALLAPPPAEPAAAPAEEVAPPPGAEAVPATPEAAAAESTAAAESEVPATEGEAPPMEGEAPQTEGEASPVEAIEPAAEEAEEAEEEYAPLPPPALPKPSQQIFLEIGDQLRRQREQLSLSLADVERYTHLRLHYLKAMEAGDMESLPSMVQGRGMLNNYAHFLNLNADAVLLRFAEGLQARREELQPAAPVRQARTAARPAAHPALRRLLTMDLLVGGTLIVLVFVFVVWGASQVAALRARPEEVQPTAPSIAEVLLATATPTATPTLAFDVTATLEASSEVLLPPPVEGTPGEAAPPPAAAGEIQVYVVARQQAFLRVTVDGLVKFNGRALAGSAYTFTGSRNVELLTGNGAALQVFYNQNDLGVLGTQGEVVDLIFTREGALTPTPSITPTVTRTLAATWTQAPSLTPRPSQTSWPTATPTPTPKS